MLRNTFTSALTPPYYDLIAQFVSKAKQWLRPVNALRREVISNAFLRDGLKESRKSRTVTAMAWVQILNDSWNSGL